MSDRMPGVPMFSEAELDLASDNYESQEFLVEGLQQAFVMSKMTLDDLAFELDMSKSEAQSWIDGDVDLHLSQLRHLANAIDAKVSYRVHPLRTRYEERVHVLARGFDWESDGSWGGDDGRNVRGLMAGTRGQ